MYELIIQKQSYVLKVSELFVRINQVFGLPEFVLAGLKYNNSS